MNPQPPVLETGALPVELHSCAHTFAYSACFLVLCVTAAETAELPEDHAIRVLALVLILRVIAALALLARQNHKFPRHGQKSPGPPDFTFIL